MISIDKGNVLGNQIYYDGYTFVYNGNNGIVIPKDRQVQINSTVMKTSVGTLDNMNIISVSNVVNAINVLKENGFWIVGTSLNTNDDYRSVDYSGKIALVIGNEGSGISKSMRDKIFNPFFSTKESGKGTGLGLSTVYNTMLEHEGILTVDSEVGVGTHIKMIVYLQ